MFTGIIKEIGIISNTIKVKDGVILCINSTEIIKDLNVDDSVSVNGVCQTVIEKNKNYFQVQVVDITLQKTTLGKLKINSSVNLELALRPIDRLGGHLVQGHINGMAKLQKIRNNGENYLLELFMNETLSKYIVDEGSITMNGVSLTVAKLQKDLKTVVVSIIPYTFNNTTFKHVKLGDTVNIEVDIIAKYVEKLLFYKAKSINDSTNNMTEEWIQSKGF